MLVDGTRRLAGHGDDVAGRQRLFRHGVVREVTQRVRAEQDEGPSGRRRRARRPSRPGCPPSGPAELGTDPQAAVKRSRPASRETRPGSTPGASPTSRAAWTLPRRSAGRKVPGQGVGEGGGRRPRSRRPRRSTGARERRRRRCPVGLRRTASRRGSSLPRRDPRVGSPSTVRPRHRRAPPREGGLAGQVADADRRGALIASAAPSTRLAFPGPASPRPPGAGGRGRAAPRGQSPSTRRGGRPTRPRRSSPSAARAPSRRGDRRPPARRWSRCRAPISRTSPRRTRPRWRGAEPPISPTDASAARLVLWRGVPRRRRGAPRTSGHRLELLAAAHQRFAQAPRSRTPSHGRTGPCHTASWRSPEGSSRLRGSGRSWPAEDGAATGSRPHRSSTSTRPARGPTGAP